MGTSNLQSIAIRVSDVMTSDLVSVRDNDRVSEAASLFLKRNVGSVLIVDKAGLPVGIITKGDVLREVFMKRRDPDLLHAGDVMSHPVVTIGPNATLEEASKLMIEKKISKLPVIRGRRLAGIITSTDIIRAHPIELSYLEELIRARFVPRGIRYY